MSSPQIAELRDSIESALAEEPDASARARRLRDIRDDLEHLMGVTDTYLAEAALGQEADAMEQGALAALARENADIREELIRREVATAEDLDALGYFSHEALDDLAEEGTLEESLSAVAKLDNTVAKGWGLGSYSGAVFNAKVRRGFGGLFRNKPGTNVGRGGHKLKQLADKAVHAEHSASAIPDVPHAKDKKAAPSLKHPSRLKVEVPTEGDASRGVKKVLTGERGRVKGKKFKVYEPDKPPPIGVDHRERDKKGNVIKHHPVHSNTTMQADADRAARGGDGDGPTRSRIGYDRIRKDLDAARIAVHKEKDPKKKAEKQGKYDELKAQHLNDKGEIKSSPGPAADKVIYDERHGELDKRIKKTVKTAKKKGELNSPAAKTAAADTNLPDDPKLYFDTKVEGVAMVAPSQLNFSKGAQPRSVATAKGRMADAAKGGMAKRAPITVKREKDGSLTVVDGNATTAVAKSEGWAKIPVVVVNDESAAKTKAAKAPALVSAEPHYNASGHVSQRTFLHYVNEEASQPTTAERFRNPDGTYDETRALLHARIADAHFRQRHANGSLCFTCDYIKSPLQDYADSLGKPVSALTNDEVARAPDDARPNVLFTGGGYAPLSLDTPIPTPSGWTTMGQIEAGDYVFDHDGNPTLVEGTSEVFTNRQCYEIEFDDGERIVADAEHRWLTSTYASRKSFNRAATHGLDRGAFARASLIREHGGTLKEAAESANVAIATAKRWLDTDGGGKQRDKVVTTAEIAGTQMVRKGTQEHINHAIENPGALHLPEATLPIDPYTLGAWLGDGTSTKPELTCADEEIVWQIRAAGHEVERRGSSGGGCPKWLIRDLHGRLRLAGLFGAKRIPAEYLRGSEQQRKALLAGLMDTDGYCDPQGACEFTSTNRNLADGVVELVVSLGGKARVTEGRAMLNGEDYGPKYRVHFTPPFPVFRLPRKAAHWQASEKPKRRFIKAVREVTSVPTRCIAVASKAHLFLAGRAMVPTHNSGKGSVLKLYAAKGQIPEDAMILDPDIIKAELPEFAASVGVDPEANILSYEEAWDIAQGVQAMAQERRVNVVVDGISNTSAEEMGSRVRSFTDRGYVKPKISYVTIPTESAIGRANNRIKTAETDANRRMIPELIMRSVHRDVSATVPGLMEMTGDLGLAIDVFDTDQGLAPDGENFNPPKLIASAAADGKQTVVDDKLFQSFLDKAHEGIPGVDNPHAGSAPLPGERARAQAFTPNPKVIKEVGGAIDKSLPEPDAPTATNPTRDLQQLLQMGKDIGLPNLTDFLGGLDLGADTFDANNPGGKDFNEFADGALNAGPGKHFILVGPLKGRDRIEEKLRGDRAFSQDGQLDASELGDLTRATILVSSIEDMPGVIEELKKGMAAKGWKLKKAKNRLMGADADKRAGVVDGDGSGYGDVMFKFQDQDGLLQEIQVNTTHLWHTKEVGGGHDLYKQERVIQEAAQAEARPRTLEELAALREIWAKARPLYDAALAASIPDSVAKATKDAQAQIDREAALTEALTTADRGSTDGHH